MTASPSKRKPSGPMIRIAAVGVVLTAAVIGAAGLFSLRSGEGAKAADPLPVAVMTAREQDTFVAQRKFAGRIVPQRTSDVGFELGGKIVALSVDEGDSVQAGQALARLDTEQLTNRRAELLGQRRETESQLVRADSTMSRTAKLAAKGFSTQQSLDDIRAERDGLRAKLVQIDAALRAVDTDLKDSVLTAPFAGQIVRRFFDEGSVVDAGQAAFRLNELGVLEARIGVPIALRDRVDVGERYTVTAGALSADGLVTRIISDVNAQTRTVTVILRIDRDPGFVPRDLVRLSLDEKIRETGIWVPATAINESLRGLWSVYVVLPDPQDREAGLGRIQRKDVEIVHIEENRVYVRGTLQAGDRVVLSSPFRFVPGQVVRFRNAPEQAVTQGTGR